MSLYYEDEFVQLHHGDCRAVRGWTTADVLVTDPPYGIAWSAPERKAKGHTSRAHDGIANDHDLEALTDVLSMWGDKPAAVFGSPVGGKPPEVKQTLVWQKSPDSGFFGTVGGFRRDWEAVHLTGKWPPGPAERSSVYRQQTGLPGYLGGGHPHAKPLPLMMWLVSACPPGIIADPFAGSGSTLIAARNLGRKAIGVELEERYCELIVKRLSQQAFIVDGMEAS
jgi:hypothetical protein